LRVNALQRTPEQVGALLSKRIDAPLRLALTRNRLRLVSFRAVGGVVRLRLNVQFLAADDCVLEALADWIARPRRGCPPAVRRFIRDCKPIEGAPARRRILRQQGRCHDLLSLWRRVNQSCFQGRVKALITWGRMPGRRRVAARRLASYNRSQDLIAVHPLLDSPHVPARFVEFIIYHEMLHALQPPDHARPHDRAFKEALRRHPDYVWAVQWEKDNRRLLGLG